MNYMRDITDQKALSVAYDYGGYPEPGGIVLHVVKPKRR